MSSPVPSGTAVASAPGRVNLIGEHLDYNGGRALPIALGMRTTARVSPGPDGRHLLTSGPLTWSGAPGSPAEGWPAYVLGVLDALGVTVPLRIEIDSEVPIGAGLSSSAALECSVALAVDAALGLGRSTDELVAACVRAENVGVGVPTGGLDQRIAMSAHAGHALLIDFGSDSWRQVPFDPAAAGLELVVVDSGVQHELADGGYARRRAECDRAAELLGLDRLAQAVHLDGEPWRDLPDSLPARVRHVVSEEHRVTSALDSLALGDWDRLGTVLTASHLSLRNDFEVSCEELDRIVAAALGAGAWGARMVGGGFGGSAIALIPAERIDRLERAVAEAMGMRNAPAVFVAGASAGAHLEPSGSGSGLT